MKNLAHLQTFVSVVEANSLTLAATRLRLSPTAVSKQLTLLERSLGIKLLHRSTRRISLTELGHVYYNHCKKLAEKIAEIDHSIADIQAEPSGSLSIMSGRYFADHYVTPYLEEFLAKYPKITLTLQLIGRIPDFFQEDVDVVLGFTFPGPPEVIQKQIAQTHFYLCASRPYLQKHGTPTSPSELANHRFISYSLRQPDHLLRFNNKMEINLHPLLRVNDTKTMIACALQGIGIIKVNHLEAAPYLAQGKLVEILSTFKEPPQPVYLYYAQDRYLQPKVRHFIDFFLKKLSQEKP
jgi:DNA-binding transcriptional LysR family regulator